MTNSQLLPVSALIFSAWMAACSSSTTSIPSNGNGNGNGNGSVVNEGSDGIGTDTVESEIMPTATTSSDGEMQRLMVKHYKSECYGLYPQLCMLVRDSESEEWTYMFDGIEDFEYSWGYDYELLISVHEVLDPPADGSSLEYQLVEMLSKVPTSSDNTFDFPSIWASDLIVQNSATVFTLGHERQLSCRPVDCQSLVSLLSQQSSILMSLSHSVDSAEPLELAQILCSDAEVTFRETCLP